MLHITDRQIDTILDIAYRKYGLYINSAKLPRLLPKIEHLIAVEGYSGPEELCSRLASGDRLCLEKFVACITTCHTFFFREPDHFRELVADMHKSPRLHYTIWCAACSTGEEPYSIAMTLLDGGIRNFHIIASDLNRKVLTEFNSGRYHESKLAQTPPETRRRYFTPVNGDFFIISPLLRNYISIKNINLMDIVHFPEPVDYVFCRNVFIYFNEESRSQAISTITSNMRIGGSLFIGHAEVLLSQPDNLKKTGSSIYRRTY
jgi:chemotaxis protein methyltransferase CheR